MQPTRQGPRPQCTWRRMTRVATNGRWFRPHRLCGRIPLVKTHTAHQPSRLAHHYQVNPTSWAPLSTMWKPTSSARWSRSCTRDHPSQRCTRRPRHMALLPTRQARTLPHLARCRTAALSTLPINRATLSVASTPSSVHFLQASHLNRIRHLRCLRRTLGNTTITLVPLLTQHTPRHRSATSAPPATRLFPDHQVSRSTATRTRERSLSSAHTVGVGKHSASDQT